MNTKLAKKLKALRIGIEFTQKQLGEALQLSELYKSPPNHIISNYETGKRSPTQAVLERYARYFMLHLKHLEALRFGTPPKPRPDAWTPAKDFELKRYFSLGCYSSAEIAEKLGRSKGAVDARKHALGLTAIKVSAKNPADVVQILKFRLAGWTQKQIGKVFGVTHAHISHVLRENGFRHFCKTYPKQKRFKNSWTDLELSLLRKYLMCGYTTAEIHRELPHRTLQAISQKRSILTRRMIAEESTYYRCTQRNRYGMPIEVERHVYGEHGELIGVEKRRVY